MKLNIPRTELITALAAVKAAARGGSLPVLSNVLLAASGKSLTLSATDLDLHLRCRTDATVEAEGATTVRAALFFDIIRMADGVDVKLQLDGTNLLVECGSARHRLTTIAGDDFPAFPVLRPEKPKEGDPVRPVLEFTLEDAVFRAMLAETMFAASTDETRYVLCGSLLQLGAGRMNVVACDGRRIAVSSIDCPVAAAAALIVPVKAVKELLRLLGSDVEKPHRLTVRAGASQVLFSFGNLTIVSKLIEGTYPDYTKIIPAEGVVAILPRAELLRCVERIGLVADNVSMDFTKSTLRLTSFGKRAEEFVGDASDSLLIPANRAVESTYSARYLRDILAAIADESVEFHVSANGVGLFKTPGREWRGVTAPVRKDAPKVTPIKPKAEAPKPAADAPVEPEEPADAPHIVAGIQPPAPAKPRTTIGTRPKKPVITT